LFIIQLRRVKDRVLPDDGLMGTITAILDCTSKANQFDEIRLALSQFHNHDVFRVDGLMDESLLMAKAECNQYLLYYLYNDL
jgi:hypothetical protein